MFFELIVAGVVLCSSYAIYKLSCMTEIERKSFMYDFMLKSGIAQILDKFNGRGPEIKVTASNEVEILLPHHVFTHSVEHVLKLDVRQDDVIVATYPKAETTWMQEIVWLICNDANTSEARKTTITKRSGFLEQTTSNTEYGHGITSLIKWPQDEQRIMKTHLPYELLPESFRSTGKGKVIYLARNPKDVCVSYYHYHRMHQGLPDPGTWDHFLSKFCSGRIGWGSWFDHNLTYWKQFQERKDQIYFIKFEDLKKNLRSELEPIADFLGKNLSSEQLDTIAEHCTFENMSKNKATNYSFVQKYSFNFAVSKFMRKGQVGDWKNHFTLNQNEAFDSMYEEKMRGSELHFVFDRP